MKKYDGEFIGFGISIILLIIAIIFVSQIEPYKTMCINGYLFTTTKYPVQILDSTKTPITCEGK